MLPQRTLVLSTLLGLLGVTHSEVYSVKKAYPRVTSCTDFTQFHSSGRYRSLEDDSPSRFNTTRHRRQRRQTDTDPTMPYFSGMKDESLQLASDLTIPSVNFTVTLWVKPEGGQHPGASVLSLQDFCHPSHKTGWTLGIASHQPGSSSFFFSLRTDRAHRPSVLTSHGEYSPQKWTHLAATYDGHIVSFYMGGVLVEARKGQQKGELFTNGTRRCKIVLMGGAKHGDGLYRGSAAHVQIWQTVLTHSQIHTLKEGRDIDATLRSNSLITERRPTLMWSSKSSNTPKWNAETAVEVKTETIEPPTCGETICDHPDIITRYTKDWQLRKQKTVKYKVINIANDNGDYPVLSAHQIHRQNEALKIAYRPYNISWTLEVVHINNTSVRSKVVLAGCPQTFIGNGECDPECEHAATGFDGGDCSAVYAECRWSDVGDGFCQSSCNNQFDGWDGGDCCISADDGPCLDPQSENRAYIMLDDLRQMVNITNTDAVLVFLAEWSVAGSIGFATSPWDNDAFTVKGGAVVRPSAFGLEGATGTLIHELGHTLGLWHVHHGLTEMECSNPCLEREASLLHGDLCSDTNPTTEHSSCENPTDDSSKSCGIPSMAPTPYKNYMSYSGDDCYEEFTPQQTARMHCYIDLLLGSWAHGPSEELPLPPTLPPKVLTATETSVEIYWQHSLNEARMRGGGVCPMCKEDNSFVQFAKHAGSNSSEVMSSHYWSPHQATGAPNAAPCKELSFRAWSPDPTLCGPYSTTSDSLCSLEAQFEYPVTPISVQLWIPWVSEGTLHEIEFVWSNGERKSFKSLPVQCHIPLTLTFLDETRLLTKVRVHSKTPLISIDAVSVKSQPDSNHCQPCIETSYIVGRYPPFPDGPSVEITTTKFTDKSMRVGQQYEYTIRARAGDKRSLSSSPALIFTHGDDFCGDGIVNSNEECDDGNQRSGDGCNFLCYEEQGFNCKGSPSLCYIPDYDDHCEDNEQNACDCGHCTPRGFMDQWPTEVTDATDHFCPTNVLIGPPYRDQLCQKCDDPRLISVSNDLAWTPCTNHYSLSMSLNGRDWPYYLQVMFERPVIPTAVLLYALPTSTKSSGNWISLSLLNSNKTSINNDVIKVHVTCIAPIQIDIAHNLNQELLHTQGVQLNLLSSSVAIIGIALRSNLYIDPVLFSRCGFGVYDPYTGSCIQDMCTIEHCEPLFVKYAAVNCTGIEHGSWCNVTCNPGFQYEEDVRHSWNLPTPVCSRGSWLHTPRCVPLNCGQPRLAHAEASCDDGYTFGSKCKLSCISPAKKTGPAMSIECGSDGLWTFSASFCLVRCRNDPTIKNGSLVRRECGHGDHSVGKQCRVQCSPGYHVDGQSYQMQSTNVECTEQGTWRGLDCVPVKCPQLPVALTGLYTCTNGRYVGSFCTIRCPKPQTTVTKLECLTTGQWSSDPGTCQFSSNPCPSLFNTAHLMFNCPANPLIGSHCDVHCLTYDQIPFIAAHIPQDTQDTRRRVDALTCISTNEWYPAPTSIECLDRCQEEFIEDGYCDAVNNHAHCDWDGGDCCASTVLGGVVRPFPSYCTSECDCFDPHSEENRAWNRIRRDQRLSSEDMEP